MFFSWSKKMFFLKLKLKLKVNEMSKVKSYVKLAILLGINGCFIPASANAATSQNNVMPSNSSQLAQLKVTPKPCVALHKGQKCYLEVTFNWQHPKLSDYCLVNTTTNETMKCWKQQVQGRFSFDFQSTLSNDFALRKHKSLTNLARTRIPVAWVYKSSKRAKSTWRLF